MKNLLIIGAGRSATALINYILEQARQHDFFITVADADVELARQKVGGHPKGRAIWLDASKPNDRRDVIGRHDVVVSLLPPQMHLELAQDCISLGKHMVTASYVSKQVFRLGDEARQRALVFMNELGLDPGIDHMSSMQRIHKIRAQGGKITAFYSYTGGLVAPESDDNPWHYKFSWNPRNVVLAGQGTAQFLEDGKLKFIPYRRLFRQYNLIDIPDMGQWEVYANRDSLLYREAYGLRDIKTLFRGTIRHQGFCDAWNALIRIGLTDATFPIVDSDQLTYHDLMEAFLGISQHTGSVKDRIAKLIEVDPEGEVMKKLEWLGLFSKRRIKVNNVTPSLILENLLLEKWALQPNDKDMVIMQHVFEYELNRRKRKLTSTLVMKGNNGSDTAMSKLVGVPLGIFVKLLLLGKISTTGVSIPTMPEVYEPVMSELEDYGVKFIEQEE
ncbi:MAG: saccharopine dehydrogenase NADP-binding domain-containing protein [Saprospiraceae bacterium]|nr:saccharopine dehydrogenase NADP-binding domain-containing protein [Saprospiraceae bacterium]MCB0574271.1 saccharopine dehydrogenase NADP-binding domain-containing protein [Saprospiraceae bacterium]MCB9354884.1 saccharopine dehydrogenase NADP-binding domain-containing protein [Lewinellaceae bacterium]